MPLQEKKIFSDITAYITGDIDPGLLIISGNLMEGIDIEIADEAVIQVVDKLRFSRIPNNEMDKVKNKFEASFVFSNSNILNKAMNLCYFEFLGNAGAMNKEVDLYRSVSPEMVIEVARNYINPSNCSTLFYRSKKKARK